ncbi:hypothetical protein M0R04_15195 [Candidatus Dojkabacteria bacterium]|jgi:hypothetical protein|nr:hypothetical protein [Candidatus Dojkabacteria bacterium]
MTELEKELTEALRSLLKFVVDVHDGLRYDEQERLYYKTTDIVETLLARLDKEDGHVDLREKHNNTERDSKTPAMIFLPGQTSSFHCSCGANVFTRAGDIYTCNGCRTKYKGGIVTDKEEADGV